MDVACEKCGTVYELEEAKLRPGGVTVKCTSCGHMFKVRRRAQTDRGVPTSERPVRATSRTTTPHASVRRRPTTLGGIVARASTSGGSGSHPGRTWLIRLESGEVKTTSELATLQQWIVAGLVTRRCEISRTGKTWKCLGEINELASFFEVADEASRARSASGAPPVAGTSTPIGADAPTRTARPAHPAASTPPSGSAPMPAAPMHGAGSDAHAGFDAPPPRPAPRTPAVLTSPDEPGAHNTGAWAAQKPRMRLPSEEGGPSGPIGGLKRGIPTDEVAFARSARIAPISEPPPDDLDDDPYFDKPAGSGLGKWIVLGALVVMLGAAASVYLFLFREAEPAVAAGGDAGAGVASAGDAGATAPDAEQLESARAALLAGDLARLEALRPELAARPGADELAVLVVRARLETTVAQSLLDRAAAGDQAQRAALERQAAERVLEAAKLAREALGADRNDPAANAVMAEVLRLQDQPLREIERYLRKAEGDTEAVLTRARVFARDKKLRQARELLAPLVGRGDELGDGRPAYTLAAIELAAGEADAAATSVQRALALAPEHAGALALAEHIRGARAVENTDPMPPEEDGTAGDRDRGTRDAPRGVDSYDVYLERADKKAEQGNCREAMGLYEQALDVNPSGVSALSGLGYCHIDQRQFASAHAKFKAALGISPRYQGALWGIAEAYQQQGLATQAIAAYRRYLDEHPSSSRAEMARRQIERLGGSGEPEAPETGEAPEQPPGGVPPVEDPAAGGDDDPALDDGASDVP